MHPAQKTRLLVGLSLVLKKETTVIFVVGGGGGGERLLEEDAAGIVAEPVIDEFEALGGVETECGSIEVVDVEA